MTTFRRDLNESSHDFIHVVLPRLRKMGVITGDVIPVEAVTTQEIARYLDMLAGIDLWLIEEKNGITGLGSRIQWGPSTYNTFTIRETRSTGVETELSKRLRAIHSAGQYIYPYWSSQAYITKRPARVNGELESQGDLLSVGIARTEDICHMVVEGLGTRLRNPDGNTFVAVSWERVRCLGYIIYTWGDR